MTRVTLVAALGSNGVIGRDGAMPWHLPEDLAHFKALTLGHPLVMGRTTFESIGRVLPGRRSIVVTRSRSWTHPGVESAHGLPEALALAGVADEVFVVGGGQIYAAALPFAHALVLTHVDIAPEGDTRFPPWNTRQWREVTREEHPASAQQPGFAIVRYERVSAG